MAVVVTLLLTVLPLVVVVLGLMKVLELYQKRRFYQQALQDFPGPAPHWLYGNVEELRGDYEGMLKMARYANQYDGAFPVWIGPCFAYLMSVHPSTAKTLLAGTDPKDEFSYSLLRPWIGDGLLLSKGQKWNRTRSLLTQSFHADLIKRYGDTFVDCTNIMLTKWRENEGCRDVFTDASLLTTDAMMRILFGNYTNCQQLKEKHPYIQGLQDLSELILKRILNPIHHIDALYYRTQDGKRFKGICDFLHACSGDVIKQRRRLLSTEVAGSRPVDFLDLLTTAKDSDGQPLTDQEIQDEVDTFLFEGHDSNASTLAWTLWHLAKHPEHQDTCRKEVKAVLGDRKEVTWSDLSKLEFTSMCIRENLRLLPPVSSISRCLEREITLPDGRKVPKGITVGVSLFALHRNPDVWHDPEVFDPYRFSNEEKGESDFFIPFSKGPRRCIGKSFAMHQAKINVAMVIRNFRVSLVPERPAQPESVLIIRSKDGVYLNLEAVQ